MPAAAPSTSPVDPAAPTHTRLHISPLTPALFPTIIPPSLAPSATNISYHTIQTSPDRSYAFLDLPAAAATKLRAKLHGTTLKGVKISVEPAREPGLMKRAREAAAAEPAAHAAPRRKLRKLADGELPGVELPAGRAVKRGWADRDKHAAARSTRSADTNAADKPAKPVDKAASALLFRAKLPASAAANLDDAARRKHQRDRAHTLEVKEFSTAQPVLSFLRPDAAAPAGPAGTHFVAGTGWVDDAGAVVEPMTRAPKPSLSAQQRHEKKKQKRQPVPQPPSPANDDDNSGDEVSSVVSSSDSSDDPSSDDDEAPPAAVHPLEALYKRDASKPAPPPIQTTFSFFANADDAESAPEPASSPAAAGLAAPQTPYTPRDREDRGIRSAAPTPDTAAIGKRFSRMPWAEDDEDDDQDKDEADAAAAPASPNDAIATEELDAPPAQPASAFAAQFMALRGDFNRSWKTAKRMALKERRQAENRRTGKGPK